MKPIYNDETGEFRIESDGEIIYGPTESYSWPIMQDDEAMDAVLEEGNIGQPQRDMWKLLFGTVKIERESSVSE